MLRRRIAMMVSLVMILTSTLSIGGLGSMTAYAAANSVEGITQSFAWKDETGTTITWNADASSASKTVTAKYEYSRPSTSVAYAAGELQIVISSPIGAAQTLGADKATETTKMYDWSYTYDADTKTYTLTNNEAIDAGAPFNGGIEFNYNIYAANLVSPTDYQMTAHMQSGTAATADDSLEMKFSSNRKSYTGAIGIPTKIDKPAVTDADDYYYVSYPITTESKSDGIRELIQSTGYRTFSLPTDAQVVSVTSKTNNALTWTDLGDGKYKVDDVSFFNDANLSILVRYPKSAYDATKQATLNTSFYGVYKDETEEVDVLDLTKTINPAQFGFNPAGADVKLEKYMMLLPGLTRQYFSYEYYLPSSILTPSNKTKVPGWAITNINYKPGNDPDGDGYEATLAVDYFALEQSDLSIKQIPSGQYTITSANITGLASGESADLYVSYNGVETLIKQNIANTAWDNNGYSINVPADSVYVKIKGIKTKHNIQLGYNLDLKTTIPKSEGYIISYDRVSVYDGDTLLNPVTEDFYTGSYGDTLKAFDMATYGTYQYRNYDKWKYIADRKTAYLQPRLSLSSSLSGGYYTGYAECSETFDYLSRRDYTDQVVYAVLPQGMELDTEDLLDSYGNEIYPYSDYIDTNYHDPYNYSDHAYIDPADIGTADEYYRGYYSPSAIQQIKKADGSSLTGDMMTGPEPLIDALKNWKIASGCLFTWEKLADGRTVVKARTSFNSNGNEYYCQAGQSEYSGQDDIGGLTSLISNLKVKVSPESVEKYGPDYTVTYYFGSDNLTGASNVGGFTNVQANDVNASEINGMVSDYMKTYSNLGSVGYNGISNNMVKGTATATINIAGAYANAALKLVKTADSDTWSYTGDGVEVKQGGLYSYKLRYKMSSTSQTYLTYIDHLETGTGSAWNGTLVSVDTSEIPVTTKVYYSTSATSEDITDDTWSMDMPADKTSIKSIAVKMSKSYIGVNSVIVNMQATKEDSAVDQKTVNAFKMISTNSANAAMDSNEVNVTVKKDDTIGVGILNLIDKDYVTKEGIEGSVFEIYDEHNQLIDTVTATKDGITKELISGTYTLKQISSPEGYDMQVDEHGSVRGDLTFDITKGETTDLITYEDLKPITPVVTDGIEVGFEKLDKADESFLSNAFLNIVNAAGEVIAQWRSDTTDKVFELEPGTYHYVETKAPDGYDKAEKIEFIVATGSDAVVATLADLETNATDSNAYDEEDGTLPDGEVEASHGVTHTEIISLSEGMQIIKMYDTKTEAPQEDDIKVTYQFVGTVPGNTTTPQSETIKKGNGVSPSTITADGYTFDGWYLDSACTQKYNAGDALYEDTILYAKFTKKDDGSGDGGNTGDGGGTGGGGSTGGGSGTTSVTKPTDPSANPDPITDPNQVIPTNPLPNELTQDEWVALVNRTMDPNDPLYGLDPVQIALGNRKLMNGIPKTGEESSYIWLVWALIITMGGIWLVTRKTKEVE